MTRRGLLLFAAMCVIWGIPYLFIRVAVGELTPATLVFVRTGVAALILMPFVLRRGGLREIGHRWVPLIAFAAIEIAGPWFFLSSAEQHITSALAGLLVSAVPLGGVAVATALGNREHLELGSMTGFVIGLAGVALIVGFDLRASDGVALVQMAPVLTDYAMPSAILGVAVLRENLSVGMLFGFALVLAGSVLATRRRAPAEASRRAPEAQQGEAW